MRIMILVPGFPLDMDNIKGGVHSAVKNLINGLANFDVEVRVISFTREVKPGENVKHVITDKIEVHYPHEGPYNYHSLNYLLRGPGIIKKHISEFNPDVIHFQEGSSFMFTRLGGLEKKKYLQTIHGMAFAEAKRKKTFKDKITWYFNGMVQVKMLPENIIHLSEFSVNLFRKHKIKHHVIIPNAIIPQYFQLKPKRKTENLLLYIGIIDNNKNLVYQLQSLSELIKRGKKFTLNVLGDFSNDLYKEVIESYVKENKLEPFVVFNGWVPQSTVLKFIESSDILVVSSKHESLPMVIAESMAAGKVVVASAVGGIPEMIDDGVDGYLYDLDEPDSLTDILEGLYNNDEKMKEISEKAVLAAQRYNAVNVAARTIEFYKKL